MGYRTVAVCGKIIKNEIVICYELPNKNSRIGLFTSGC